MRLKPKMNALRRALGRFRRDARGAITIELAYALPILAGLLMSGVEVTRFVLINQKLERTAATMGDLITRMPELTEADIVSLFQASDQVMTPYDVVTDGRVIVTSISGSAAGASVDWQRNYGTISAASQFGDPGNPATLPAGFLVREDENAVTAEVFFDFKPILATGLIGDTRLSAMAVFRPRFSKLDTVLP